MTTEADRPIRTERRGAALWLWLNRPHALNSLTLPMIRGLHQGLDLAADPGVRVVVIAGQGRAFCAGADLTQVLGRVSGDAEPAAEDDFLQQVSVAFDRLEAFGKPVIAAVQAWPSLAAWSWCCAAISSWPAGQPPSVTPTRTTACCPQAGARSGCPAGSVPPAPST
jgi:1,4-dihydroxy-2-naphthoyl-CoA synthase